MAKLVAVITDDPLAFRGGGRECRARRQLPLPIEPGLTMVMDLEDCCLACCGDQCTEGAAGEVWPSPPAQRFLDSYRR